MADWRSTAKAFALGDGHISMRETEILRKALFADGKISKSELDFLKELKAEAQSTVKLFDELLADVEAAAAG